MQSSLKSLHKNGVANLSAHKGWKGWEKFFHGGFNRADVTYSKKGFKAQFWLPRGKQGSLLRLRVYPKTSLHFCTSNNHVDFKCIPGQVLMNFPMEDTLTKKIVAHSDECSSAHRFWGLCWEAGVHMKWHNQKWIQFKTRSWKLGFHHLF